MGNSGENVEELVEVGERPVGDGELSCVDSRAVARHACRECSVGRPVGSSGDQLLDSG